MDRLENIVREVMVDYTGSGFNVRAYPMVNDDRTAFTVIVADHPPRKRDADILIFVRIEGEFIIVETDSTDHPVVDVLVAKGIPRNKIICAYAGETLPTTQTSPQ